MKDWEAVYQAMFQGVYHYALRLCREPQLAQDLTQETFLRAMDAWDSFRGEGSREAWLYRITRNLFYSHVRKQGRVIPMADLPLMDQAPGPEEALLKKDEELQASRSLLCLPEPGQGVLRLRAQGLSFREIGELYHKSENWACVTFHRARKKAREYLNREEEEHGT